MNISNQGVNGGWAINDSGAYDFLHSIYQQLSLMKTSGAKYVRIVFRLGQNFTDWTHPGKNGLYALQQYDHVVNAAIDQGLEVLGLLPPESWQGDQSAWCQNNAEQAHGNGDNVYLQAFSTQALLPIATHFRSRIHQYEIWNEPNAWTSNPQPGVYMGGSFLYPSNFAWLLHHCYNDTRMAGLDGEVVSGGIFSHNINNTPSPGDSYLIDVYNQGLILADWISDRQAWGSYPLDSIGQHIYIDQGVTTNPTTLIEILSSLRNAYTQLDDPRKNTIITEIGWTTASISPQVQAQNVQVAYQTLQSISYVGPSYWFSIQDIPEASLYYGLFDGSGHQKTSAGIYQASTQF